MPQLFLNDWDGRFADAGHDTTLGPLEASERYAIVEVTPGALERRRP